MKLPHRRQFLHLAAGAAALPAVPRFARAQTYPAPPVRVIVPVAGGGGSDITARLMGQWVSEGLGQPSRIGLSSSLVDRSIAGADHSRATDHRRATDHSIAGDDSTATGRSIVGVDHSIAGTERRTPGMVRREGSRLSSRHVLVSSAWPPQRSSLRQSEAFS